MVVQGDAGGVRPVRIRRTPRMSSHKLGDYCVSRSATERERIIREQVVPPTFLAARYGDADTAIRRSLLRGGDVAKACRIEANRIRGCAVLGEWREQSRDCSAASVEAFADLWDRLDLSHVEATFVGRPTLGERIEGVDVSSRPLVLLKYSDRRGVRMGALLTIHRKEKPTTLDAGKVISALLARALVAEGFAGKEEVDPSLCLVVDVFHNGVFRAPKQSGKTIRDVQSACREIVVRWQSVVEILSA